jgi:type VI secretion system protein ImpA
MAETPDELTPLAPISAEAPCGPDLDAEGDGEFLNFLAAAEGYLPSSFFAFDRKLVDFPALLAAGRKLLDRTHDVRLLSVLAKLSILNRDLDGFSFWLSETGRLVADYWDEVHPRGEGGDFAMRMAQLATFNDGPVVILPLQYAPLAETQREGEVCFRAQLVAFSQATAREGETLPDSATIEKILLNSDLENLKRTLAALQAIKTAADRITAVVIEKAGFEQAPSFEALTPLVERMASFVQAAVARRDPSVAAPEAPAAVAGEAERPAATPVEFASLAEVDAALASALGYFARSEPSSAAVLLIGQARQLLGKNIYEVMKALAPSHAEAARVFVGAEPAFSVPVSNLGAREQANDSAAEVSTEPAASRAAALALIESVAAHLRNAEPSSPVPFLLDRARGLASRDFFGLLKELLSGDALAQMRQGGG